MQTWIEPEAGPTGAITAIDRPVNVMLAVALGELAVWSFPPYAPLSVPCTQGCSR